MRDSYFHRTVHHAPRGATLTILVAALLASGCSARRRGVEPPAPATTDATPPALMVPVEGIVPARVPDTFNAMRGGRTHRAIDFAAPRGTPVVSVAGGQIYRIRHTGPGGLAVYATDSTRRWMFYYAHLDRFRDGLTEGMTLAQGDVIGFVGTTGNAPADTPHLHFQLMHARFDTRWWDGEAVDPRAYFVRTGEPR
jgi:murein DD-endopeptidase MepM/ murein hydrolase activator NlpD